MRKKTIIVLLLTITINVVHMSVLAGLGSTKLRTSIPLPPGSSAPDFTLVDIKTGEEFSLSSITNEGKVVILDLFATWCNPCKQALPYIREIYYSYYRSELTIISIDVDNSEDEDIVRPFMDKYNMDWIVALDTDNVSKNYGSEFIPTMYIIDSTQTVAYAEVGFDNNAVIEVLNSLITGDIKKPTVGTISIEEKTLTLINNTIAITIDSITDDIGIKSVYAEITTNSGSKTTTSLETDGTMTEVSVDDIIEIDQKVLYLQDKVTVSIKVRDYKGNIVSNDYEYDVDSTTEDKKDPVLKSVKITFTENDTDYIFTIKATIIDDVCVYRVKYYLREGEEARNYQGYLKRSSSDETLFTADVVIDKDEINDPNTMLVKLEIEDVVGNETLKDYDESVGSVPSFTFLLLLLSFITVATIQRKK